MSKDNRDTPRLAPLLTLTVATAWGAAQTWSMLSGPDAALPVILAGVAGLGALKTLKVTSSLTKNIRLRREAYGDSDTKGSARWMTRNERRQLKRHKPKGMVLGCDEDGKPLFAEVKSHVLTVGPAGTGKTSAVAVPQLMHTSWPVIATDVKGTLYEITKWAREKKHHQKAYALDPAHLCTDTPDKYNPLIILLDDFETEAGRKSLIADAEDMALKLLPEPEGKSENEFFRNGSRKIIIFCLAYVVTRGVPEKANLCEVLRLIRNESELMDALYVATCSDALKGELADKAQDLLTTFKSNESRYAISFREGAEQALMAFAPSGWLAESTSTCTFRFRDLKKNAATVYLIVDPEKLKVFRPWAALIWWAAIRELTRCRNNKPVLMLMDEASNFPIHGICETLTLLREFGCHVHFLAQELEELARVYGKSALATILSQTSIKQFLGGQGQSPDTADLISRMLGDTTVKTVNYSLGHSTRDKVQLSVSDSSRRLMTSSEIIQCKDTITFIGSEPPNITKLVGYHQAAPWRDWAGLNPLQGRKYKGKLQFRLRYSWRMKHCRVVWYRRLNRWNKFKARLRSLWKFLWLALRSIWPLWAVIALAILFMRDETPHLRISAEGASGQYYTRCTYLGIHGSKIVPWDICPLVVFMDDQAR